MVGIKQRIFLILSLVFLVACGSDKPSPSGNTADPTQVFPDKKQLLAAIKKSSVVCAAGIDCPDNIAKLSFWFKNDNNEFALSSCSGTLIENEFILTNRHCIPKNIQKAGADCSEQIIIQFPGSKKRAKKDVSCDKVVQVFPEDKGQPDMAVLQLADYLSNRTPVRIVKNAFTHHEKIVAYTVDPSSSVKGRGVIVKKECQLSLDNLLFFRKVEKRNIDNALISGRKCKIIGGNSGSGVFNEAGQFIGVIHSRILIDKVKESFQEVGIRHQGLSNMGIIVNAGCMKALRTPAKKACPTYKERSFSDYLEYQVQKAGLEGVDEERIEVVIEKNTELTLFTRKDSISQSLSQFRKLMTGNKAKVLPNTDQLSRILGFKEL